MVSVGSAISIFPAPGPRHSYLVLVWSKAEVLDSLSGVLGSSEEKGVATSGGSQGQLIDGQSLTTSGKDAGTGGSSEAESCNTELGNL